MSHYTVVKTRITKLSALKKALCRLGFKEHMVETFEQAQGLKGYKGDTREQKAHVRIKGSGWGGQNYVGDASNDLGWEKLDDGSYAMHVSDYDRSRYDENWQKKLLRYYALESVYEVAAEQGFYITEEQEVGEEIYLKATTPY